GRGDLRGLGAEGERAWVGDIPDLRVVAELRALHAVDEGVVKVDPALRAPRVRAAGPGLLAEGVAALVRRALADLFDVVHVVVDQARAGLGREVVLGQAGPDGEVGVRRGDEAGGVPDEVLGVAGVQVRREREAAGVHLAA